MRHLLHHIKSNAVGYVALFVALGGTSYAAISLPQGSVGTRQLRNGAVTSRKLAKQSVTAAALDPKTIAGHVADWAQIRADGHVLSSRPRASVTFSDPTRGIFRVSWHQAIPQSCITVATPSNVPAALGSASADTFGPVGRGRATNLLVQTFDSAGGNVPINVSVLVVCP